MSAKELNLKSESDLAVFLADPKSFLDRSTLMAFVRALEPSSIRYGKMPIFTYVEPSSKLKKDKHPLHFFTIKNRIVFGSQNYTCESEISNYSFEDIESDLKYSSENAPTAIVITSCDKRIGDYQGRTLLLINGDVGDECPYVSLSLSSIDYMPIVSLSCLCSIFEVSSKTISRRLADGELSVVDYEPDTYIDLTESELNLLKSKHGKKNYVPPLGFKFAKNKTVFRPSSVLIRDEKSDTHVLVVTDQEAACNYAYQFSSPNCKSIAEAFEFLNPENVRVPGTMNQGGLSFVPIPEKAIPNCVASFKGELSITHAGDEHEVYGEGLIGENGNIYVANSDVSHSCDEQLHLIDWHEVIRKPIIRFYYNGDN